jgi:phage minor structural protein
MTLETRISALSLLSQLDDELVTDYTAENKTITQIVTALLAFQINPHPILLGTIEPTVSRSIEVQQDTIFNVLTTLRDTVGGYIFVDKDRKFNWLNDIGEDKGQQIRYRKNIKGLYRTLDFSNFGNRLYCYGAGEGTARIKLSDAEGYSLDYVEDTDSQDLYGIAIRILVDKSITHPDTLKAWADLKLDEMKLPRHSYRVDMVNLAAQGWDFEQIQLGSMVKVIDESLGVDIDARIVYIKRNLSNPTDIQVEISNPGKDIVDTTGGVYDTQQLMNSLATKIGAGQVVVLGEFTVSDWLTPGTTNIKGDNIRTGQIQSNNWGAGAGSLFNLNDGTFKLGGSSSPKLSWNGTALVIQGTIYATAGEFSGTLKASNIQAGATLAVNGVISAGGGKVQINTIGIVINDVAGIANSKVIIYRPSGGNRLFVGWEDDIYAYIYSEGSLVCQGVNLLLQGGYVQVNSTILRAPSPAYTDLGDASYYFDEINYKTLTDRGCPMPTFKSHTEAIMNMKTRKRKLTITEAKKEGMGKRAIERIRKYGTEIEEFDVNQFPEDFLDIPTQEDWDNAEKDYQERLKKAKDPSKVMKYEPKIGYCLNEIVYSLVRSHQEMNERLNKLEAS